MLTVFRSPIHLPTCHRQSAINSPYGHSDNSRRRLRLLATTAACGTGRIKHPFTATASGKGTLGRNERRPPSLRLSPLYQNLLQELYVLADLRIDQVERLLRLIAARTTCSSRWLRNRCAANQ